jgi:hypothetical protein
MGSSADRTADGPGGDRVHANEGMTSSLPCAVERTPVALVTARVSRNSLKKNPCSFVVQLTYVLCCG